MIKGIIFDMDGVLVDSEPLYHEYGYHFFRNLGADITPEYLLQFTGSSLAYMFDTIFSDFNITSVPKEDIITIYSKGAELIYSYNPKLKLCTGIIDWLEYFKANNYPMAIASSTYEDKIEICLERFNLKQYFTKCIGGNQVENSKPNPDIFIKACQALNLKPSECIVIEDSSNGIKAAKAAGCFCIGYLIDGKNTQNITESDIVFDTFGASKLEMLTKLLNNIH